MRFFVVFSTVVALLLSASLHMTRILPMSAMDHADCGSGVRCVEASAAPLMDCLDHCLSQQAPTDQVIPMTFGWTVLTLFACFILLNSYEAVVNDAFCSGRDAPFGKYDLHRRWASVMIKS